MIRQKIEKERFKNTVGMKADDRIIKRLRGLSGKRVGSKVNPLPLRPHTLGHRCRLEGSEEDEKANAVKEAGIQ